MRNRRYGMLSSALLLTLLLAGCGTDEAVEIPELAEPASVGVNTVRVEVDDIYQITTCDGQIVPVTTEVKAEYSGLFGEMCVKEGDVVREGDVVARLSDESVQAQLAAIRNTICIKQEQDRLNNEIAACDLELLRLEAGEGAETSYEIRKAELLLEHQQEKQELEMKQLREQEQELQEQIVECEILAPVSGRVIYVAGISEGAFLQEKGVVAVIASEEELLVRTDFQTDGTLSRYDVCQILSGGQEIPVEPLPYDRNEYVAAVLRKGSFYTYYQMAEQPEEMQAGEYVQLQILRDMREQVCVLPQNCLYRDANGSYVYRIEAGGNRVKVPVATGVRNDLMVEITEGLKEGDEIYVRD